MIHSAVLRRAGSPRGVRSSGVVSGRACLRPLLLFFYNSLAWSVRAAYAHALITGLYECCNLATYLRPIRDAYLASEADGELELFSWLVSRLGLVRNYCTGARMRQALAGCVAAQ